MAQQGWERKESGAGLGLIQELAKEKIPCGCWEGGVDSWMDEPGGSALGCGLQELLRGGWEGEHWVSLGGSRPCWPGLGLEEALGIPSPLPDLGKRDDPEGVTLRKVRRLLADQTCAFLLLPTAELSNS